jgi:hypothetical protein
MPMKPGRHAFTLIELLGRVSQGHILQFNNCPLKWIGHQC